MKFIKVFESRNEFLSWKRKNITIRGINNDSEGDGGGSLGLGLYTAFLSNRKLAKEFGQVVYVLNGIPKNPIIFNSLNEWEVYIYKEFYSKYPTRYEFNAKSSYNKELTERGYDGVIIKGREMVNYNPENIIYFYSDTQLENYFYDVVYKG